MNEGWDETRDADDSSVGGVINGRMATVSGRSGRSMKLLEYSWNVRVVMRRMTRSGYFLIFRTLMGLGRLVQHQSLISYHPLFLQVLDIPQASREIRFSLHPTPLYLSQKRNLENSL